MLNYVIKILILSLFLVSCKTKTCKEEHSFTYKIGANRVLLKKTDSCDSRKIILEQEFLRISDDNYIPNGSYKEYYPNGFAKVVGEFKNGKRDGIGIFYFKDGSIKSKNYFEEGQLSGPQYEFYTNGKMKSIIFHKNDSIAWFGIDYEKDNSILDFHGKAIRTIGKPHFETLKSGEVLAIINQVPLIENLQTILNIKLKSQNAIIIDTNIIDFDSLGNLTIYGFGEKMKKSGIYIYSAKVQLVDKLSKKIIRNDSSEIKVVVKK